MHDLRVRTEMVHESGAFLLGQIFGPRRRVLAAVYYDDLDPGAYDTGICVLRGPAFSKLWAKCREKHMSVLADVHVHPGGSWQSYEDRTNPTIAKSGHLSIIVPNFARPPVHVSDLGVYEYCGNYEWRNLGHEHAKAHLYIGLLG